MDHFERVALGDAIRRAGIGIPNNDFDGLRDYAEACALIAAHWASRGQYHTPEEIFNYSPTGELYMIGAVWLPIARYWQQTQRALPPPRT